MPPAMKERLCASLLRLRRDIDSIDRRLAPLLARRLQLAARTAALKRAPLDRARERAVLRGILRASGARGRAAQALAAVYREIFRASRGRTP